MKLSAFALGTILGVLAACRSEGSTAEAPAEHTATAAPVDEHAVSIVRPDADAVAHLGIETTKVATTRAPVVRTWPGIVAIPPGGAIVAPAPVAGTLRAGDVDLAAGVVVHRGDVLLRLVPLAPVDRDTRAQAKRQRAATKARLDLAQARVDRLTRLLADRASSPRAIEEATAELETARAEDDAARNRVRAIDRAPLSADVTLPVVAPIDGIVRTISATVGQSVGGGAPLFEIAETDALWIRVPVVPGALDEVDLDAPAAVARLGRDPAVGASAVPVKAPPSADPLSATVALFYALPRADVFTRPGERVRVTLPQRATEPALVVPAGAIVRDFDGGAWVYTCDGAGYLRAPVEIGETTDDGVRLRRGPPSGTCIVAVGAVELLGIEFGLTH